MVNRFTLYNLDKKLKYCPYCKKYIEYSFLDKKYYIEYLCLTCKNIWCEGESAKNVQKNS
jgi:hypothetical protein